MEQESNILLLCHASTLELGRKICSLKVENCPKIKLHEEVSWEKFPDGFPNLFIQDVDRCIGKHVVFLGSFHSPEVIFEQISLVYALPRSCVRSLTFILPYFPTGTMERIDTEGQVATASTMARMLSAIPLSAMGPAQIMIFDIHVLQERFFFTDNVLPRLQSALPRLLQELNKLKSVNLNIKIAFPDEGAHKRFRDHFDGFAIIRCIKKRNGTKREVSIVDGSPNNCHIVIVDDLIMTGGTVNECALLMKKSGASSVSAYVTHAVFPADSWKDFLTENHQEGRAVLDNFWITDSIPHAREISNHEPFKLLSLAESICRSLHKLILV